MGRRKLEGRRKPGSAATVFTIVLLAGILMLSSRVPDARMYASSGTPVAPTGPTGWLKGRVTDAITGLGLIAIVVVSGPQAWAGNTDPQGYYAVQLLQGAYSVTAFKSGPSGKTQHVVVSPAKATVVNFQLKAELTSEETKLRRQPAPKSPPKPGPTPTPTPEPTPTRSPTPSPTPPSKARGPHLIATKVGFGQLGIDASNVSIYASRYDVIFGAIPASLVDTLRALHPGIILLQYNLPGGVQSKTRYPESYYVRDVVSGLKVVNRHGFWLLNFADPVVRQAVLDRTIDAAPAGVDGYWLDTAGPGWLNGAWWKWRDEADKIADLGSLDGSWDPSMPESDKGKFADGTWPLHMLNFQKELKVTEPGKLVIYNGMTSKAMRETNSGWTAHANNYLSNGQGTVQEGAFVVGDAARPENGWKWHLDKFNEIIQQGKYIHIFNATWLGDTLRKFGFASYLLIADGKYAWYHTYSRSYDSSLYDVDYGAPLGPYHAISTSSGPIYKRRFTKATVWVNPGDVTRSGDGKTLGSKTAIIETTSN